MSTSSACAELSASVEARDGRGRTTMHWACRAGDVAALLCLHTELGANVDARDERGATLLMLAASRARRRVPDLVDDLGADCNLLMKTARRRRTTPRRTDAPTRWRCCRPWLTHYMAAANNSGDVIERLVDWGVAERPGRTSSHGGALGGRDYDEVAALKKLQSLGASLGAQDGREDSLSTWPTGRIQRAPPRGCDNSPRSGSTECPRSRPVVKTTSTAHATTGPEPRGGFEVGVRRVQTSTRLSPSKRPALLSAPSAPRLLFESPTRRFPELWHASTAADSAQKLSWQQFRRVVASLAVLAKADLALSPLSPRRPSDRRFPTTTTPSSRRRRRRTRRRRETSMSRRETSTRRLCLRTRAARAAQRRGGRHAPRRHRGRAVAFVCVICATGAVTLFCAVSVIHAVAVGNAVACICALAVFRARRLLRCRPRRGRRHFMRRRRRRGASARARTTAPALPGRHEPFEPAGVGGSTPGDGDRESVEPVG